MMGKQVFAPKLYYQLSLDKPVPENHLLRQIASVVDFSFVYPLAKSHYSHTGQPSVDPAVIFKTMLIGYLYGITSERRLMNEIQVNMAYRWFLGYDLDEPIPDHSVLTKARSRFGMDVFEKFFERSIQICAEAGLLKEGPVYVDATHIGAAASLDSLIKREETVRPPLSVKDHVRKVYEDNPVPQSEGDATVSIPTSDYAARRDQNVWKRPPGKNDKQVSRTDPEATIVNNARGGLRLAYKAHVAVSGKRGLVVTAAIATTGIAGEEHWLNDVLQYHTRYTGMQVKEAVADTRYGTLANYDWLDKDGISAFIPPHERTNGVNGLWGKDHFRYVPEQDSFLCPAGKTMRRFAKWTAKKRFAYRCEPGTCESCSLSKRCVPRGKYRTVSRLVDQRLVEEARERTGSPVGRELMRQRKTRIEGIFALGKELHGLRRTRLRGNWKVQIQLWLTATVINLKRAVKEIRNRLAPAEPSGDGGNPSSPAVISAT
ncbi:IS1182 family transposase [Chloroflexota bacterium]